MSKQSKNEYDVVVIGGGVTGCGTARDLALRGLSVALLEKEDFATGTSGRNHGLLHSGARYAVNDPDSAIECIKENKILKKIARHVIEDTGGFFVLLNQDDPAYLDQFFNACKNTGIYAFELDPKKAKFLVPTLSDELKAVVQVPDGAVDPFRLAAYNAYDAAAHGALVRNYSEVVGFLIENGNIVGVKVLNKDSGEITFIRCKMVVNASGVWGGQICKLAGISLPLKPSKGSLIIIDYRINNIVINRCRKPGDADIIVPGETVSIVGTTSVPIDENNIDHHSVSEEELEILFNTACEMMPSIRESRILRAYSGVRPLLAAEAGTDDRNITRNFQVIDHKIKDGVGGLVSIIGGKLMTYRLMAEKVSDKVCNYLGVSSKCTTHSKPLPGSEHETKLRKAKSFNISKALYGSVTSRHGTLVENIFSKKDIDEIVCECELVTRNEINFAIDHLFITHLLDLRRRIRIGMGPCQGAICILRTASQYLQKKDQSFDHISKEVVDFIEERWIGLKPVLWEQMLRETEFYYWMYQGMMGLSSNDTIETDRG